MISKIKNLKEVSILNKKSQQQITGALSADASISARRHLVCTCSDGSEYSLGSYVTTEQYEALKTKCRNDGGTPSYKL